MHNTAKSITLQHSAVQCGLGTYNEVYVYFTYTYNLRIRIHIHHVCTMLTEAVVIFGMWHMLLTTSVAFDSLSDSNSIQSLQGRPLYLYFCLCFFLYELVSVFDIHLSDRIVMQPVQVLC